MSELPSGFFDGAPIVLFDPRERELAFMMRRLNRKIVLPVPTTMWGFFYNSDTWNSADSLISLHVTKRGAFKAMVAHRYAEWMTRLHPDRLSTWGVHMRYPLTRAEQLDEAKRMDQYSARCIAPIPVQRS